MIEAKNVAFALWLYFCFCLGHSIVDWASGPTPKPEPVAETPKPAVVQPTLMMSREELEERIERGRLIRLEIDEILKGTVPSKPFPARVPYARPE